MRYFTEHTDYIETCLTGKNLMTTPQLNKGTAFSQAEREKLGLLGKVPARIETLDEQVDRALYQLSAYTDDLQKHIYLNNLHDKNQVLFYKLISQNLTDMIPLIYTPCIGTAVQQFSHEFRQARGLFINYENRFQINEILDNRTNPDIDLIVVTDGEGVLGIGDQGVGAINIPIAKLMVYTLCAGISPLKTLPIYLDVGTNNQQYLADKYYLGERHPRISQAQYDEFIEMFIHAVSQKFPKAFLHFEDFGRSNAKRILNHYQDTHCIFNDDIQGTGGVALAAILAATNQSGTALIDQRIVIFGAGTAGMGIADQIYQALLRQGLSPSQAREKFWLVDKGGLLTLNTPDLTDAQKPYARNTNNHHTLLETIKLAKPSILIGCSAQPNSFTEEMITLMASFHQQPIILPLSNPTEKAEAIPDDLIRWTDGRALIATGSPFKPVKYKNKLYSIAQCNNALIYPGIGLGVLTSRPKLLTDDMLWHACLTLSQLGKNALLPSISDARSTALEIALAMTGDPTQRDMIKQSMWQPRYVPLKFKSLLL